MRVLIVEDEQLLADQLRDALKGAGFVTDVVEILLQAILLRCHQLTRLVEHQRQRAHGDERKHQHVHGAGPELGQSNESPRETPAAHGLALAPGAESRKPARRRDRP